nr:hypothetical protein [Tanacetum cinerariifolium]
MATPGPSNQLAMRVIYELMELSEETQDWSLDEDLHFGNAFADDMPIMDEVIFKIHKNRYFEFDPLRKLDACSMSPHELVKWEQQEADSPYLGTLLLKPRRKADELVLDDNWQYEGLVVDDVGGSIKHCDLVHENVVYKGHSLPNMDKERFLNNVVLDDVVTDTLAYTLPKRVAIGGHGRGLGRLIGLNVDAVDDDP